MPAVAREGAEAAEDAAVVGAEGTRRPLGLQVRRAADSAEVGAARLLRAIPMRRNLRRRKAAAVVPSPCQEPIA